MEKYPVNLVFPNNSSSSSSSNGVNSHVYNNDLHQILHQETSNSAENLFLGLMNSSTTKDFSENGIGSDDGGGYHKDHQTQESNDMTITKPPPILSVDKKKSTDFTTSIKVEKKIKKHRYAFQTRSQVDILDDGYRWRKYGQKTVKNNRHPRSYYRCTHQGCNVKKQVQRLSRDEGVVVTTYEGMHSHPIEKPTDNFEHILKQMQIFTPLLN